MKSYVIVGLGRFGSEAARRLYELGCEVLVIDNNSDLVQQISQNVTQAVVGDARDKEVLKALGAEEFDCAIVAIGNSLGDSVLATMNLKELGVPYVVCKAHNETHRQVLLKLGANKVLIPEQEQAFRLARNLSSPNVLDYIELSDDYGIIEVPAPLSWVGKSLKNLNVRAKLGVNIIAVKQGKHINVSPGADYEILPGDVMVVLGGHRCIKRCAKTMIETITSRKNPLLQQVKKLLDSRKFREETGLFAADGTKLLQEAIRWCPGLHTVILSPDVEMEIPDGVRTVVVPKDVMASVSPMQTPQGALFLCRIPDKTEFSPKPGMILLDGIQDPGNLGTILRTADALQIPVALLEKCADPYSHKVVRASMGAVFRMEIMQTSWQEAEKACRAAGIPVGVTALNDTARDLRDIQLNTMAVVIGSEGQGVRREILESAQDFLIIPMNPNCESLNAAIAAAIVMWQMRL